MSFSRRQWLQASGFGLLGISGSGWMPLLADQIAPKRHCILLWMTGGPSQLDTFDLKPEHENGGEFKPIATNVSGIQISEHLPQLAKQADQLAILRGLSTKEGDHGRGTFLMRTGHGPTGPIRYPSIGASLSKALGDDSSALPNFVSISPYRRFSPAAFGSGFLGPRHEPLTVGAIDVPQANAQTADGDYAELGVDDLELPEGTSRAQMQQRKQLWESLQAQFRSRHGGTAPEAQDTVYRRAFEMMNPTAASAFDLTKESDSVREAYGRNRFGQGCLLARRLVERGVPFVEVSLGSFGNGSLGWDSHRNNFETVKNLSQELDAGWANLMHDLKERGLLEQTTILWMGEFGRTPKINQAGGRDHYPNAWTCVMAGGGIQGGQVYGRTSVDGTSVADGKTSAEDVLATLCWAVGVDPQTQYLSNLGRPIRIAEGSPIQSILS